MINGAPDTPTKSIGQIVRTNMFTFFNLVNVILAGALIAVNSVKNALFIGVIICNTAIGIFQEVRAKRVIDKLSLISAPRVCVIRNGRRVEITTAEILLGDLNVLSSGQQICADSEIISGECEVNESLITGESDPVIKKPGDTLLSGSFVISGAVRARVIHIGNDNYASKVTSGAKYLKKQNSEMLRSLNVIVKAISICIVPIAAGLLINSLVVRAGQQTIEETVVSLVGALIGMIPEGLILLASVVMAVSVIRLAMHKTLVQEMYCIETLARVDTLCLDKTGTITEGCMQVEDVKSLCGGEFPLDSAICAFTKNSSDENPTFLAIKDRWNDDGDYPAERVLPFSSAKKWSGAEFAEGTLVLGAPEFVLKDRYGEVKPDCEKAAAEGTRVLLFAYSKEKFNDRELPAGLIPAALIFIGDKIRAEAPETLDYFAEQGVDIKIISGDNPLTVSKIAARAGVRGAERYCDASALSEAEIPDAVRDYSVFGRVSPAQKLAMVKALKSQGHTVGMTGDGVNDVLALKEADCSVAMQSGSEAARRVSNLVLLDSNFASMPKVVAEGRRAVNNIERSATLFLTKTCYSFFLAIIFLFVPQAYPLDPIQLTLISSTAIGVPSFLLALEPNFSLIRGSFITNSLRRSVPQGITMILAVCALTICCSALGMNPVCTGTVATTVVGIISFAIVVKTAIPLKWWKIGMTAVLFVSFAVGILPLGWFFSTCPFTQEMAIVAGVISAVGCVLIAFLDRLTTPVIERIEKWRKNRRKK